MIRKLTFILILLTSIFMQNVSAIELSNHFVLSMALDGGGNVWVGTEAGLNCIAGHTVSIYRREQMGTTNDKILSLFYDRHQHRMLIGTEHGLAIYDCEKGIFGCQTTGDRPENYSVVDMADDHQQGVWLIFGNGKIQHLDCSTYRLKTLATKLPGSRCGMDDGRGHLYIGHSKEGVSIVDLKDPTVPQRHLAGKSTDSGLPSNNVRRIVKDSKGQIWIGTDCGLAQFIIGSGTFKRVESQGEALDLTSANVYDIKEMADGHLWIATDVGGVMTDDGTAVETTSMNTRCILQDDYQNIWIGNHSTGVDFIPCHKPLLQTLDFPDMKVRRVYGITSDSDGHIWVSSEDELSMCVSSPDGQGKLAFEGRWKVKGMKHRAHTFARCLMADSQGYIWMGMEDEGVIRFDIRRQTFEPIDIGYDACDIHSFMEDSDGRIWIGAEDGVCTYAKGQISHHNEITRLTDRAPVTSFIRLTPTQLLLTTQGRGILIVNTKTMQAQRLTMAEGLPTDNINQALADRQCGLWLASSEGLIRLPDLTNLKHFTVYNTTAGLTDRQVRAIQQDSQGRIWASTYTGIACLDTVIGRFYNYGQQQKFNASGFMEGAATTLIDGSIAFGSSNGVYYLQPEETETNLETSPVKIVMCEVFSPIGKEVGQGDKFLAQGWVMRPVPLTHDHLELSYQQNTLRIAYTVSDYAQLDEVEYSYMMKGLSDKWYPAGSNHEVTFRNLRPGNYTFVLRAKLRNQKWEKATTTQLSIRITPPFWLSWWAYIFYAMLVIAVITFIVKQYKRRIALRNSLEMTRRESLQKQELNEERLRFFTNITHELRTPLTLILGPLEDLLSDYSLTANSRKKVELIYKSAGRLRNLINEILEFRKTETQNRRLTVAKGDVGQIAEEIVLNYKELNRNPQVAILLNIAKPLPAIYFDSEVITTVLNNLLSNAVKYTERGSITVSVSPDGEDSISLSVTDTGYGISADALPHIFERYYQAKDSHQASGTGIGLALVKSLADLHEAELTVESQEGKGSKFNFRLNISNTYPNALHKEDEENEKTIANSKPSDSIKEEDDVKPLLLIVEDNEDIRQYIADSLGEDFHILQATNGADGCRLAEEQIPDIIVSDIMMPKMNGIQLTKRLKEDIRTSHIPIILLTAKNTDIDKEEGYESGADSYLTKPFTTRLLESRIRNLLNSRRRLAELLIGANGAAHLTSHPTTPHLSRLDQEFISQLNSIIEQNIMQTDIDMAFLTDKMAMSHSTFYRKVKALTGLTAKEYVRRLKLRHCYRLLESGDYNVTEAAMMTGFNQMAHFREVFKKEFGILPSEVKK